MLPVLLLTWLMFSLPPDWSNLSSQTQKELVRQMIREQAL